LYLTEQHIIKKNHSFYNDCDSLCFASKNLYNSTLYVVRKHYFEEKKYLSYGDVANKFVVEDNKDYRILPAKVSQQTLKLVDQNFKSFFSLLKKKNGKVRIPKYLDKIKGRQCVVYNNQTLSKPLLSKGIVKLSKTNIELKTRCETTEIQQVRIVPKLGHFVIEIVYKSNICPLKDDNGRYASIDLGLNNLATVGSNVCSPIIINGKPLKSINQFYNKKLAELRSKSKNVSTKRTKRLHFKRNNKIKDYLHKSSKMIINHLVSNDIYALVIGHNKQWKQEINIGKVNNQKFVNVPHSTFI